MIRRMSFISIRRGGFSPPVPAFRLRSRKAGVDSDLRFLPPVLRIWAASYPRFRPSGPGRSPADFPANYFLPTRPSGRPADLRPRPSGYPAPAFGLTIFRQPTSCRLPRRVALPPPSLRIRATACQFFDKPPPADSIVRVPASLRPSGPPAPGYRPPICRQTTACRHNRQGAL